MKKEGVLVISLSSGRMDIRFGLNDYYGGLHCGTQLEAQINGEWVPTRIEMKDDWYLVGIDTTNISGLTVRI